MKVLDTPYKTSRILDAVFAAYCILTTVILQCTAAILHSDCCLWKGLFGEQSDLYRCSCVQRGVKYKWIATTSLALLMEGYVDVFNKLELYLHPLKCMEFQLNKLVCNLFNM